MKLICIFIISLILTPAAVLAQEDRQVSCPDTAEMHYAYHTEVLMHAYETARLTPREFESLRTQLVERRETDLQRCWGTIGESQLEDSHETPQYIAPTDSSSRSRGIASVPAGYERGVRKPFEPPRRGAYTEVVPQSQDEVHTFEDQDGLPIYTGERVSIGN